MPNLVVNSGARIQALVRNGKVDISVEAAIPGRGIRRTTLSEERQPEVVAFLRRVGTATEAEFNLFSEQEIDLLREFGILVPEPDAPGTIPLDLTLRKREAPQAPPQVLIEDLQKNLPNIPLRIPEGGRVIWVRDAVRDVWFPSVLDRRQLEGVQRLMNGGSPNDLGPEICEELSEAGILDLSPDTRPLHLIWQHTLAAARDHLDPHGYTVIPCLLPHHLQTVARDYYDQWRRDGFMKLNDEHAARFSAHREPFAEWLHQQIDCILKPIFSGRFKPSYSFVCAYAGGADLPRHTDRAQCEVTLSLCVDASPGAEGWPLYLESPTENVMVESRLGVGHALVFKGRQMPHSRKPLAKGEWFVALLFHFVEVGFDGSLD